MLHFQNYLSIIIPLKILKSPNPHTLPSAMVNSGKRRLSVNAKKIAIQGLQMKPNSKQRRQTRPETRPHPHRARQPLQPGRKAQSHSAKPSIYKVTAPS